MLALDPWHVTRRRFAEGTLLTVYNWETPNLQWRWCQSTWTRPIFRWNPTRHLDSPFSTVSDRIELTLACAKNTTKLTDFRGCCPKSLELLDEDCLNNWRLGFVQQWQNDGQTWEIQVKFEDPGSESGLWRQHHSKWRWDLSSWRRL